ncbi:MAG: glycosyltransferase [Chromatiaceae bacterium]|nr:MAG: glycosyltransferase [Chromatiaceae bacterium]
MDVNQANLPPELAIVISFSGQGGVERMITTLAEQFVLLGKRVDLVAIKEDTTKLEQLEAAGVNVVKLHVRHSTMATWALARYLDRRRPSVVLAAKDRAGRSTLAARRMSSSKPRVFIRIGTTLSEAIQHQSRFRQWLRYRPIRRSYPQADGIVAISQGVADDVGVISNIDRGKVHVIPNPVIGPALHALANSGISHPWVDHPQEPVIIGMGRLTRQKDFQTLIKGFAELQKSRKSRLIILGEGRDRYNLTQLVRQLGIENQVDMPGHQENPYCWLNRASLFVLSSRWEGFGNVLAEAMALGTPVVSTDCRSGPRELLDGGRLGPLVPVGDPIALSRAMRDMLDHPTHASVLKDGVKEYHAETSARRYLEVMGLEAPK